MHPVQHSQPTSQLSFLLASDLHLEPGADFSQLLVPSPGVKVLALCGDLSSPFQPEYAQLLAYVSPLFQHVLVITGNNEYSNPHLHRIRRQESIHRQKHQQQLQQPHAMIQEQEQQQREPQQQQQQEQKHMQQQHLQLSEPGCITGNSIPANLAQSSEANTPHQANSHPTALPSHHSPPDTPATGPNQQALPSHAPPQSQDGANHPASSPPSPTASTHSMSAIPSPTPPQQQQQQPLQQQKPPLPPPQPQASQPSPPSPLPAHHDSPFTPSPLHSPSNTTTTSEAHPRLHSDPQSQPHSAPSHTMREVEAQVELLCSAHGNVTFLNNSCVVIEGVQFVGSTLWTWVPLELRPLLQRTVLDFSLVLAGPDEPLTPHHTSNLFTRNVDFIERSIASGNAAGLRNVVLTHHTPSFQGTSAPQYADSETTCSYSSDLDRILDGDGLAVWCCGHTHHNFDQVRAGGGRLVSNQRGQRLHVEGFRKDFVVTL